MTTTTTTTTVDVSITSSYMSALHHSYTSSHFSIMLMGNHAENTALWKKKLKLHDLTYAYRNDIKFIKCNRKFLLKTFLDSDYLCES